MKVVGCDWMIESTARENQCGVCHGDDTPGGSTECRVVAGGGL